MAWLLVLLPATVQMIVIGLDEGYFHIKRGLPKWERIGHPLDTLSVLACIGFVLFAPYSSFLLKVYIGLALFSCLLVTKDEFVHKECCPASEQWLHAILFINHPILLASLGCMWPIIKGAEAPFWLSSWITHPENLSLFLNVQFILTSCFLLYQIIYWNFIWKEKKVS